MARIHPTAIVSDDAQLAADVEIGAFVLIGPQVTIGAATSVGPYTRIEGPTTIGERNQFFGHAIFVGLPIVSMIAVPGRRV